MKIGFRNEVREVATREAVIPGVNLDKCTPVIPEHAVDLGEHCRNIHDMLKGRPRKHEVKFRILKGKLFSVVMLVHDPIGIIRRWRNAMFFQLLRNGRKMTFRLFIQV